ncbi:hypothetical protein RND71_011313 [Anisodus tanguticus]|uniref:Pectate lyase N-terminal domain-containing protein n=1 Tax=Anisodus tanguticus TaxID=243964 RepID=A0AAE1SEN8_9SOLA|nr:hypothetical protein RND71_011313 [Anisodus tanguticus]
MALTPLSVLSTAAAKAAVVSTVNGHIGDFDEVWRRRAQEADEWALKAYKPDPLNVTLAFAKQTRETLLEIKEAKLATNETRRQLKGKKYNGPCLVTNPIDRCWRCQPNWADNRKRLADCAMGFAKGTTGGRAGRIYVVTDNSDDSSNPKPGTLRYGVIQKEPLWIIFATSMNIRLTQELIMQSDKTIDGRGVNVHIANGAVFGFHAIADLCICIFFLLNVDMQITKRDYAPESVWKQWTWRSQGDLLMNGAFFVESGDPDWTRKHIDLFDGISSASGDQVTWITRFSGALNCEPGQAC